MTATTKDGRFTVQDYMALPEGFPAQLIEGGFVREPAPNHWHQEIVGELFACLRGLVGRSRVLVAPADVVLDRWNVMHPDVLVFAPGVRAREAKDEIPVLVAEVLSPGTALLDRGVKCAAYLRAGVGEVWLVDPDAGTIEVRTHEGGTLHGADDEAVSAVVPGFRMSWRTLAG